MNAEMNATVYDLKKISSLRNQSAEIGLCDRTDRFINYFK